MHHTRNSVRVVMCARRRDDVTGKRSICRQSRGIVRMGEGDGERGTAQAAGAGRGGAEAETLPAAAIRPNEAAHLVHDVKERGHQRCPIAPSAAGGWEAVRRGGPGDGAIVRPPRGEGDKGRSGQGGWPLRAGRPRMPPRRSEGCPEHDTIPDRTAARLWLASPRGMHGRDDGWGVIRSGSRALPRPGSEPRCQPRPSPGRRV
jgi:hypothetical protein